MKRVEEPEKIDEKASDKVLDKVLGEPPTRRERDWYLNRPKAEQADR